jgi:hypothetical protein
VPIYLLLLAMLLVEIKKMLIISRIVILNQLIVDMLENKFVFTKVPVLAMMYLIFLTMPKRMLVKWSKIILLLRL